MTSLAGKLALADTHNKNNNIMLVLYQDSIILLANFDWFLLPV